jgi:hypothetical protein
MGGSHDATVPLPTALVNQSSPRIRQSPVFRARVLKYFTRIEIHRREFWISSMHPHTTLPLPAAALRAIANLRPCEDAPEQACFPWFDGALPARESCESIRLRLAKLAAADKDAERAALLMVSEKVDAVLEAGANLMEGATPADIAGRCRGPAADKPTRPSQD